jgi:hypothetical protein
MYPMIYIFTKDSWDKALANPSSQLKGKIYNGKMTTNGPVLSKELPNKKDVLQFLRVNRMDDAPILTLLNEQGGQDSRKTPQPQTLIQKPTTTPSTNPSTDRPVVITNRLDPGTAPGPKCQIRIVNR